MKLPLVAIPRHGKLGEGFSQKEKLKAREHPGRRTKAKGYQSPAAWVDDLVSTKTCVILCSFCRHHFNHRKRGYRERFMLDMTMKSSGYDVNGKCDGCKQETALMGGGRMYVSEEYWRQISMDPVEARRLARHRWQNAIDAWNTKKVITDFASNPNKYGRKHRKKSFTVTDRRRFARS